MKIVEGDEAYGKMLKELSDKVNQIPRYTELTDITLGGVSPTIKDSDLNDLRVIMWGVTQRDKIIFVLNPLRTSYQETCTIKNVTYVWRGLNTLTYHGTLRTFTEVGKEVIERRKTQPPESE